VVLVCGSVVGTLDTSLCQDEHPSAQADAIKFLDDGGKFAIFDATNSARWT